MGEHSALRFTLIFPEEGMKVNGIKTPVTFKKMVSRRAEPTYFDACEEYMMDFQMYTDAARTESVDFTKKLPADAVIYAFFPPNGDYKASTSDAILYWSHIKACEERVASESGYSGDLSNLVIARYELDKLTSIPVA